MPNHMTSRANMVPKGTWWGWGNAVWAGASTQREREQTRQAGRSGGGCARRFGGLLTVHNPGSTARDGAGWQEGAARTAPEDCSPHTKKLRTKKMEKTTPGKKVAVRTMFLRQSAPCEATGGRSSRPAGGGCLRLDVGSLECVLYIEPAGRGRRRGCAGSRWRAKTP
eukprot:scaffold5788_cov95-Isochrysis_galbana.AAC.2